VPNCAAKFVTLKKREVPPVTLVQFSTYLFQKYCNKNDHRKGKIKKSKHYFFTGPPPRPAVSKHSVNIYYPPSRLVLLSAMVGRVFAHISQQVWGVGASSSHSKTALSFSLILFPRGGLFSLADFGRREECGLFIFLEKNSYSSY
jgi:hypothetical protein